MISSGSRYIMSPFDTDKGDFGSGPRAKKYKYIARTTENILPDIAKR